jgi:endo-1,4-beta-xylanase
MMNKESTTCRFFCLTVVSLAMSLIPSGGVLALLLAVVTLPASGQMAATSNGKFVGCTINGGYNPVDPDFDTYWNQVTPENSGKWGNVEATRDVMDWTWLDLIYAHSRDRGIPFKQHTFVWGNTTPAWIDTLTQVEQREEVEEWIAAFAARYPDTELIDVVNEALRSPASYREALGGAGATGWDWVIWTFEKARQYFPNAKLLINDHSILLSDSATTQYLTLINLLKDRGLIDGIGEQGHFYESTSLTTLQANLDRLAATGLPIYISEFDLNLADDTAQLNRFQQLFPVFWTHPSVRGITFWGYKQGAIWRTNAYLLRTDGSERPAMTWLKNYIATPQTFSASVTSPANGQTKGNASPVSASATINFGTPPFTVTFQKKLDSESVFTTVSSDNTFPYTADLGILPAGTYQIYVSVTDSTSATTSSPTNTFDVVHLTNSTWVGFSGNWADPGIWTDGIITDGIGSTASFTGVDIAADQTVALNSNRTIGNIVFTDAATPSHNLTLSGANLLTLNAYGDTPIIDITQADRTLTVSFVVAGNEGLQKAGLGTLTLSGGNTYSGTTTISSGTLKLQGNAFLTQARNYSIASGAVLNLDGGVSIAAGTTTISGGGTLLVTGGGLGADADGRDLTLSLGSGALIDIASGGSIRNGGWQAINWASNLADLNVDGTLEVWDGTTVKMDALTGSGTITKGQAYKGVILGVGVNNGSGTFSGTIGEGSGANGTVIELTKSGTGTQTLSGANTYDGTTTVNGGTLQFAKTNSLYEGVTTNWVKTKIIVKNGGGIAFNIGGPDEFTTGNVTTLLSGLGGTVTNNGLRAGSTIAFDTSNASGGAFTITNVIANTTGTGGGAVGLRKLGVNTLVLASNSTYTGSTIVDDGTLAVTGSLGATAVSVNNGGTLAGNGDFSGNVAIAAGAVLSLDVASSPEGQDTSAITGTLAMDESTLNLTAASTPAPGIYVLATATVDITGFPHVINYNGINGTVLLDTSSTPKRLLLAVPGGPYDIWAAINAPGSAPDEDFDGDGVCNACEFVFGGDKDTNDFDKRFAVALSGSNVIFTFKRVQESVGSVVSVAIEVGTDIGTWPDVFAVGADTATSTPGVTVTDNLDGTDAIILAVPMASENRKFARLKIIMP